MRALSTGGVVGPYRVLGPLGAGGMGTVYRARHEATGHEVALKLLSPELARDLEGRARFAREAEAMARLRDRHVVQVHETGVLADGTPWLAAELVAGGSLAERLRRTGTLPWSEAVALGAGIARGLDACHRAGFLHRDLKPANVLLGEDGTPRLADMGLVRPLDRSSLTASGLIVGTPAFMAPEQVQGARDVGPALDLHALGATLFALLAGRPPFAGEGIALLKRIVHEVPPPVRSLAPDVPPALDRLVARLLSKDPAARGASAAEVAGELEALRSEKGRAPGVLRGTLAAAAVALAGVLIAATVRSPDPGGGPVPAASVASASRPSASPTPSRSSRPADVPAGRERAVEALALLPCRRIVLLLPTPAEARSAAHAVQGAEAALERAPGLLLAQEVLAEALLWIPGRYAEARDAAARELELACSRPEPVVVPRKDRPAAQRISCGSCGEQAIADAAARLALARALCGELDEAAGAAIDALARPALPPARARALLVLALALKRRNRIEPSLDVAALVPHIPSGTDWFETDVALAIVNDGRHELQDRGVTLDAILPTLDVGRAIPKLVPKWGELRAPDAELERVVAAEPTAVGERIALANRSFHQVERARLLAAEINQLEPSNPESWALRARTLEVALRVVYTPENPWRPLVLAEMLAAYGRAIELDLSHRNNFALRGGARLRVGAADEALADLDHAVSLGDTVWSTYEARAAARLRVGWPEAAVRADFERVCALRDILLDDEAFLELRERFPDLACGWKATGRLALYTGAWARARSDLARARALDPLDRETEALLLWARALPP